MPIVIIGIIVLIIIIAVLGPMILSALGNLIAVIMGLAVLAGLVALGIAFPPLGIVMLVCLLGYAVFAKGSSGGGGGNGDKE